MDGLEPGHGYTVTLNVDALRSMKWAPVTKDEILVDKLGPGSQIQDFPWSGTPLNFNVNEVDLHISE